MFTANGGLVIGGEVVLPQFRHPERQPEQADFAAWFRDQGFTKTVAPRHDFEGEGDALLCNGMLFAGYPWRSDKLSHDALAQHFDIEVVSLQLTDARFYHLDTALTVVSDTTVALFAPAFTAESVERVRSRVPHVICATSEDAEAYGLNAISDGQHIVLSDRAHGLIQAYRDLGLTVWPTPIGEFQKSGVA